MAGPRLGFLRSHLGARGAPAVGRYNLLQPDVWQRQHERQRALYGLAAELGWTLERVLAMRVLDVGCGTGGTLLELLALGFHPELLAGVDLDADALAQARAVLPTSVTLHHGDALDLAVAPASLDLVHVATVFSSIREPARQARLAATMWRWLRPGGGVLWYDFTLDSPFNAAVRGVPVARLRELFPTGELRVRRVTLAPPLARAVTRLSPALYPLVNSLPLLRTHALAWIGRPR